MEIYFDYAAATPLSEKVLKSMELYFNKQFANPSSRHLPGQKARIALDQARSKIGKILDCRPDEIIFCSTGTEANNLALQGFARANQDRGKHLIVSQIEHSSILETAKYLEKKEGFTVTYLPVDQAGFVDPAQLAGSLTPETILVSIIYANNEIGTIQNLRALSEITKERKITLHTDACQAAGKLLLNVHHLGVDMMTLSASKIYGPKGTSCLYKNHKITLSPLLHGGGQEFGLRSSTQNVSAIVGFARALELADIEKHDYNERLSQLTSELLSHLGKECEITLNGPEIGPHRLANNLNIRFHNIDNNQLLLQLDQVGIACSTGSACSQKNEEQSHVLTALGLNEEKASQSIRISLGSPTTTKEIQSASQIIPKVVAKIKESQ